MKLRKKYWVLVDFGGDHLVRFCEERPYDVEWQGPFDTWREAKNCILKAGAVEIAELRSNLAGWRQTRRSDVVGLEDGETP